MKVVFEAYEVETMEAFKLIKKLTRFFGSNESAVAGAPASNSYIRRLFKNGQVKINNVIERNFEMYYPLELIKTVKVGNRTIY